MPFVPFNLKIWEKNLKKKIKLLSLDVLNIACGTSKNSWWPVSVNGLSTLKLINIKIGYYCTMEFYD